MGKHYTKIICAGLAAISVAGAAFAGGCGGFYSSAPLDGEIFTDAPAVSNGGFAVEKGNYVYFINGVEANTAANDYGKPVKGAIYRISKDNLKNRNYSTVDKVVGNVAYSADYNSGIYIYGDSLYYATPSTARNADGVVQNSTLDLKSAKLDGSQTMKNAYVNFPNTAYEYRFVEAGEDKTVYLLYVATEEKLYEESTGVTNLHSYNTETGADTLLAYNVSSVIFDSEDKTNARVYYTMNVQNYATSSTFGYNQVYTVTADATKDKFEGKLNSETVKGWNDDEDEGEVDRYINCGDLVLDGIGKKDFNSNEASKTVFNYEPDSSVVNELGYTYTLKTYVEGNLFYTRKTSLNSSEYLFSLKDGEIENPILDNPDQNDPEARILADGSKAGSYKYIFDGDGKLSAVIAAEEAGISINKADENGNLHSSSDMGLNDNYFKIVKEGTATLLFADTESELLYYSVSGGNGYTINRIQYNGSYKDYEALPAEDTDFTAVKILDLDADSAWYKPEIIDGYILFASETANMTSFNYVMVFDFHKSLEDRALMTNEDIRALNEKYEGIKDIIDNTYGDTEKYPVETYANISGALNYAFYAGDYEYLKELAEVCNSKLEEGENYVYSEETFAEYDKFLKPAEDNVWAEYTDTKKVNGSDVYANTRDYYYAVLGEMTEDDEKAYMDGLKTGLVAYPEEAETGWYEGLSVGGKVGFIIGMCAIGLLVAGGAAVLTIWLVRKNKNKRPEMRKRKIKVDTTDDKDIDVYAD